MAGPARGWSAARVKRALVVPLVRALASSPIGARHVSIAKTVVGVLAAATLAVGGYWLGLAAALLLFGSRVLDATAGCLARAQVRDAPYRLEIDFGGDVLVLLATLVGAGFHLGGLGLATGPTPFLIAIGIAGVVMSAAVAYAVVLRGLWAATVDGGPVALSLARQTPRLAHRDGAAYGLLLAAIVGRVDLFLWAAAIASQLVWITLAAGAGRGGADRREPTDHTDTTADRAA